MVGCSWNPAACHENLALGFNGYGLGLGRFGPEVGLVSASPGLLTVWGSGGCLVGVKG